MVVRMTTSWPPLPYDAWKDTLATLHRYMQIVGKLRLHLAPIDNHFWSVAFHLTARGLTSRPMVYDGRLFEIEFDLVDHRLRVRTADAEERALSLDGRPVAVFYRNLGTLLASLGIELRINDHPVEMPSEAIPFHEDYRHATYDRGYVERFFGILWHTVMLFEELRTRFIGKASPVHFYWGSFDLAYTRFSGRRAPPSPEADAITREAYSHEVWSGGFWPGDVRFPEASFYAYAQPPPSGFPEAQVAPQGAFWYKPLGEYLLPYEVMRRDRNPRAALLAFLQSTYEAAADLGDWDREALERRAPRREEAAPHPAPPAAPA
jgi:Family of unknown function (DUF5996)